MNKRWLTWNQTTNPINWSTNSYTWEEVYIVIKVGTYLGNYWDEPRPKGATGNPIKELEKEFTEGELDFFIKVVCKVNNLDYEVRKARKTKPLVSINEIKTTIDTVKPIVSLISIDI